MKITEMLWEKGCDHCCTGKDTQVSRLTWRPHDFSLQLVTAISFLSFLSLSPL